MFRIYVIGPKGSGKTTYLKRFFTGHFDPRWITTVVQEKRVIYLETNRGRIGLEVIDCPSNDCCTNDFTDADAAILFHTLKGNKTDWFLFWLQHPDKPICHVFSKCDLQPSKDEIMQMCTMQVRPGEKRYMISSKSNYNYEKPIQALLQQLMNDPMLIIK